MSKSSKRREFESELEFVAELEIRLPKVFASQATAWQISREVAVGRSIADVAALLWKSPRPTQIPAPFSTAESVILAALRLHGPTRIDLLESRVGLRSGGLRRGCLDRLEKWELIRRMAGGYFGAGVLQWPKSIVAIEAKLTRWREALDQAIAYTQYADQSYVALPEMFAGPALRACDTFKSNGIGLIVLGVRPVVHVKPLTMRDHDWRREFIFSRLAQLPTQSD